MNTNGLRWAGFTALLLLLALFGWFMVPAHLTSLWMDREFTDWISPIANRMHGGARLYADGMHVPMPPLPYVLVRLLHPAGAVWIQENLLYCIFQAGTLLLLYHLLARHVGAALAFAACMAAVPVFLALGKSILYDSMAQFLVVASGGVCARLIHHVTSGGKGHARGANWKLPGMLGLVLGLLILCKQSTGLGAFFGVGLALLFLPGTAAVQMRRRNVILVAFFTVATVCLLALAMASYVSFPGMTYDVFLTGSEPKGGTRRIVVNLLRFSFYLAKYAGVAGLIFCGFSLLFRRRATWRQRLADVGTGLNFSTASRGIGVMAQGRAMLAVALASGLCAFATFVVSKDAAGGILALVGTDEMPIKLLNLMLAAALILIAASVTRSWRTGPSPLDDHPLASYSIIFLMAAIFHSLSVTWFRWTYDNNPLIVLALVFLFSPLVAVQERARRDWVTNAGTAGLCAGIALMWTFFFWEFKAVMACTESWPEIKQLAGARLRPECEGMRELVNIVQVLADPARHETVLLLPNDPNVEAWFDRERPALSCAILFTDQYWDSYVDRDFAALQADPPKVIIIGPRNYWRFFSKEWHWYKDEGVIRLIDLVSDRLLTQKYDLRFRKRIHYGNGEDFMDVYVRRG